MKKLRFWAFTLLLVFPLFLPMGIASDVPFADVPFDVTDIPEPVPPPKEVRDFFDLDPFYQQWINVEGFPVLASEKVNPYAVREAAWIIWQMIGHRSDILQALVQNRARFTVMAYTELTTDIPEHSNLRPDFYHDRRNRGLGATPERPSVSCGEENLLSYPGDPYWDENVLVHEFAHALHQMGLNTVNPDFDERLRITYDAAMKKGLWQGTYAATNEREYWAEGTQAWFNTGAENNVQHNHVNTRAELKIYDSALATLLTEVYGDGDWRYTLATARNHLPHLKGFNPQDSPRFEWPPELTELYQQLSYPGSDGGGRWVSLNQYDPNQLPRLINESGTPGSATEILFMNLTQADVLLYWVAPEGTETFWERFAPDPKHVGIVLTFARYIWLVKDLNGRNLAVFQAKEKTGRALINPAGFLKSSGSSAIIADVNNDGNVNVLDLIVVASKLGNTGTNLAGDVNQDGVISILDLILVAGMFEGAAAAPSAQPQVPETLTAVEVQGWLTDARALEIRDPIMKRGFVVLEQLLVSLTPKETQLLANYPNPFNPETWIPYRLAADAFVTLTIYDSSSQVVRTLDVGHRIASTYESRSKAIHWDGRNGLGEQVASGVYFYTLTVHSKTKAGDFSVTRRMMILK